MLSLILYGRNDSYGYNLHKRAAISLNCMAEVLQDPSDEILFVDYNTPNDFPTFPEAIQDTLSYNARRRLRILRVRPRIHERFKGRTHLAAIEPVSRNIAIRRSNPNNRWILSTNTDMIFVPRSCGSLTAIVRKLPRGIYGAPRIELPESLWEGLDRLNPADTIERVGEWGRSLHLNELVRGSPVILYDGPGDFQLIERQDLFDYHAFNEEMVLGWHVDSNLFKRMGLVFGGIGDLAAKVYGYHCDHTRQVTPSHSHNRNQNSPQRFVDEIVRPDIMEQAESWGCPDDEIEEINLNIDKSATYVKVLQDAIGAPLKKSLTAAYTGETYNRTDYDPRHVLPYLVDLFVSAEKRISIGWFGGRRETLGLFSETWRKLGFTGRILVDKELANRGIFATHPEVTLVDQATIFADACAFVFDYGAPDTRHKNTLPREFPPVLDAALSRSFLAVVWDELVRMKSQAPRPVIAINAINNAHESMVCQHIAAAATPFGCRLRHGFVIPSPAGKQDLTALLQTCEAAVQDETGIHSSAEQQGCVVRGPYLHLGCRPGRYRLEFSIATSHPDAQPEAAVLVEGFCGRIYLGHRLFTQGEVAEGTLALEVDVDNATILKRASTFDVTLKKLCPVKLSILRFTVEYLGPSERSTFLHDRIVETDNLLPLLTLGSSGNRYNSEVSNQKARSGLLVYGPHCRLPEGVYEAIFTIHVDKEVYAEAYTFGPVCTLEVSARDTRLGALALWANNLEQQVHVVRFVVTAKQANDPEFLVEFKVTTCTTRPLTVKGLRIRHIAEPMADQNQDVEWLPFLSIGVAGRWGGSTAIADLGKSGHVVYGPYWPLPAGYYETIFRIAGLDRSYGNSAPAPKRPFYGTVEVCTNGIIIASKQLKKPGVPQEVSVLFSVQDNDGPMEARVWASGIQQFCVESVVLRRIAQPLRSRRTCSQPDDTDRKTMERGTRGAIDAIAGAKRRK